jgi:hypothetical protein
VCATSEINEGVSPFVALAGEDEGRGRPAPSFLGIQLVGRNQAGKFYAIGQVCASRVGRVEAVSIDHKLLIDRHLWVESCQQNARETWEPGYRNDTAIFPRLPSN